MSRPQTVCNLLKAAQPMMRKIIKLLVWFTCDGLKDKSDSSLRELSLDSKPKFTNASLRLIPDAASITQSKYIGNRGGGAGLVEDCGLLSFHPLED